MVEADSKDARATEGRFDHQQTVIESARNSEQLIDEIEKNSDSSNQEQTGDHHPQSHSILISSETEIMESGEVMMVMDEETAPDEDKVFYMDPGFAVPENDDLLELEYDTGNTLIEEENSFSGEQEGVDQKLFQKTFTVRTDR